MNTKKIAVIAVFAALTIALNLSPIKIPAPYAPFLIYQIWEIPIVAAFLIYGADIGFIIAIINTIVLIGVFPGALPTGPLYNLIAVLSMLCGVGIAKIYVGKHSPVHSEMFIVVLFTAFGVLLRAVVMGLVNWSLLGFPPPVGFSLPQEVVITYVPLVIVFNVTLALYTIPLGYFLAKTVKSRVKT